MVPSKLTRPFDPVQADAILDLQLYRLTRLSIDEILKELAEVRGKISEYESILASRRSCAALSSKNWKRSRRTMATSGAPSFRTKPPRSTWKT